MLLAQTGPCAVAFFTPSPDFGGRGRGKGAHGDRGNGDAGQSGQRSDGVEPGTNFRRAVLGYCATMPEDTPTHPSLDESFFRRLVEAAPDGVLVLAEARIVFVNAQAESLFGYRRDELVGQPIEILIPDRHQEAHRRHRAAYVHEPRFRPLGEGWNLTGRRKDGTEFPADIMLASLETAQGQVVQAVIRDLTELRRAEKTLGEALRHQQADLALRASEERHRTLFDVSRDGIVIADLETGAFTHANRAASRMLGYSEEEFATLSVADIHPKEALPRALAEFADVTPALVVDLPCLRKDGTIIYADVNAATVTIEGRTSRVGFFRDVTERKRSEEALRESEGFLRETQRVANLGSYVMNVSTGAWRSSDVLDGLFGIGGTYERSVEGWANLIHPDDRAMMLDYFRDEVLGLGHAFDREYRIIRHDNRLERWVHGLGTVRFDADGRPVSMHGTIQDITARKRAKEERAKLEEQLRHAQKMDAIGNLAGGVAHDFNNLLSVILSYSALLATDLKDSDPIRADVLEIEAAARRGADLTRQLLAFGRRQVVQTQPHDLNDIVQGLEKMLRRLIGEGIDLTVVHTPHLGMAVVDKGQIEQIVVNLVVNARDAMPHGGKLTIEVAHAELDAAYAAQHVGVTPGPHVVLLVSDTGTGMDRATQDKMFEPFFTTKEKGKGTGLGLATVFGMVKQSGGFIWVHSTPGVGTTMKVYFPRAQLTPVRDAVSSVPPVATLRGTETILIVEDEEQVRLLAGAILRRSGYHVLDARSGGDGLLLCEQHVGTIHLMLTDVVMPRMSGRQLAERLKAVRPEMKVLYMSGYTDDSIVHHGVLDSGVAFLQKPLTPEALTRKVREVLDGEATG